LQYLFILALILPCIDISPNGMLITLAIKYKQQIQVRSKTLVPWIMAIAINLTKPGAGKSVSSVSILQPNLASTWARLNLTFTIWVRINLAF